MTQSSSSRVSTIAALILGAALLGFAGGWVWQASGLGRGMTEQVVQDYILENPEILPEAMQRLQQKETLARLEPLRGALEMPSPGVVLGDPEGTVTLVEFTDYACPYCRMSVAEVDALIAEYDNLKVVVREHPVLSQQSVEAARMALAAGAQGRYAEFHKAMFSHEKLSAEAIQAAAKEAGLDLAQANADIKAGKFEAELENTSRLASAMGLTGTPAWIVGESVFSGAVGRQRLADAIEKAAQD